MDPNPEAPATTFDRAWSENHRHLVALASRMLHDPAAAEDVVQEAFARLAGVSVDEIDDVRAWLSVVVRRLCLNRIYSAYVRREAVVDSLDPGPLQQPPFRPAPDGGDPADRVTLDDQVQLALAIVLDRLTPGERTAFVLHDVFGFPFDVIGQLVGRTTAACRQLASRARRSIRSTPPPFTPTTDKDADDQHVVLAQRFIEACTGGDIEALVAVLDPDVTGFATLPDGRRLGPGAGLEGADATAARLVEFFGPGTDAQLVPVALEDTPGAVAVIGGRVQALIRFDAAGGVIRHIRAIVLRPSAR